MANGMPMSGGPGAKRQVPSCSIGLGSVTVRDLRQRSGDLLRDAEQGKLALITKHGRPAILAVPFDERLLSFGVHRALALHLFEAGQLALAQAAKLAGLSLEGFIELLGRPASRP